MKMKMAGYECDDSERVWIPSELLGEKIPTCSASSCGLFPVLYEPFTSVMNSI